MQRRHKRLTHEANSLAERIEILEAKLPEAKAEVERLKAEAAKPVDVAIDDVKAVAEALEAVQADISTLAATIEAQEAAIAEAEANAPDLEALNREREDLAAKVATGEAEAEALDQLERRIAESDLAYRSQYRDKAAMADRALPGLRRKLTQLEAHQAQREAELERVIDALIETEARQALVRFERAVKRLEGQYWNALGILQLALRRGVLGGNVGAHARLQRILRDGLAAKRMDAAEAQQEAVDKLEKAGIPA